MCEKNYLPLNLRYLREANNMSQPKLAEVIGCSRDNIASYERGTEPKLNTLRKIVNYFHVSMDDIVNSDLKDTQSGKKNNSEDTTTLSREKREYMRADEFSHTATSEPMQQYPLDNIISIPIVDVSAAAGHGYFNPDHPETLGELSFPTNLLKKKYGNYYCGRVNGESMAPTLLNQDFIIFRLLNFDEWISVEDDSIYFIVDRSGASCVKRIKNRLKEEHGILCTSDSFDKASFRDFMILGEEIANIYHVEWRFSKDMTNINQTYFSKVEVLEEQVKNIQEIIQNKLLQSPSSHE